MGINLNKISPRVLFVMNLIVILLLTISIALLIVEIYDISHHGGDCMHNPMRWAEKYALEERDLIIDCSCIRSVFNISELNISGGIKNGKIQ